MAESLLLARGDNKPLGKNWMDGFIRRNPHVKAVIGKKPKASPIGLDPVNFPTSEPLHTQHPSSSQPNNTRRMSTNILIIGATRGLGESLRNLYASNGATTNVFATTRSKTPPKDNSKLTSWLTGVDISQPDVGQRITSQLPDSTKISTLIISAGYFGFETFDQPDWAKEVKMYTTSAIGPVFVVNSLVKEGFLREGSKVILVSSESGSIALRHEKEGGGNFGHHGSKAALNMTGKLLSLDLKDKGIAVGLVHPGFMRTEMTRSVGFDKYWDAGGAVTPDEAAASLASFIEEFDISKTGQYWAPRGPGDIGTAKEALGDNLPTPLQLPW